MISRIHVNCGKSHNPGVGLDLPLIYYFLLWVPRKQELEVSFVFALGAERECHGFPEKVSRFVEPVHWEQILLTRKLKLVKEVVVVHVIYG